MISSAVDASAVARVVGIKTQFKDLRGGNVAYLPQRIMVVGQGSTASTYPTTKKQVFSAGEVAETYGYGSPLHLAVSRLLPVNGDGVGTIPVTVYPLVDDGSGVESTGSVTPTGTVTNAGTFQLSINGEIANFNVKVGDTVADICAAIAAASGGNLSLPMTASDQSTSVDFTSKWKGASANGCYISVTGGADTGITIGISQPTGGAVNPDVDSALTQIGEIWETLVLNCMDIADTATLDKFKGFGDGLWIPVVARPFIVFTGTTEADVNAAITVSSARSSDRINAQLVAPGSENLPFVVAARQLARIAVLANNNPPVDYGGQQATGLNPGIDSQQWSYSQRDTAVKGGSSTVEIVDGIVNLSDVVTFYAPTNEAVPAYRYVVDIIKLQQIIFNTSLIFKRQDWNGAPLIPDGQPTTNPSAKKPKAAVAELAGMIDSLGLNAIIADSEGAKKTIVAAISENNPKRLDTSYTVQLSGNSNIISVDLNFGFFFGQAPVVA